MRCKIKSQKEFKGEIMGLFFGNNIHLSDTKREELVVSIGAKIKKLKDDYVFSIEFLDGYQGVEGYDEAIAELKEEFLTGLDMVDGEIKENIQALRQRVDSLVKSPRWMGSEPSRKNVEGLNQTVGKLMALEEEVKKSRGFINEEKHMEVPLVMNQQYEQPVGPQ